MGEAGAVMEGLKIAIIGAGIGGLSAGIALRNAGFQVNIYEQAATTSAVGAGVCMWPNGAKGLNALGFGQVLSEISPELTHVHYREKNGELLCEIPLTPFVEAVRQRPYPLTRADLQAVLLGRFGRQDLTFGAECIRVEQSETGVTAFFADGREATADLMVGADGIRSVVRESVVGPISPRYAYPAWVGTVAADTELNPKNVFTMYVGDSKRVGLQPVSGNRFYFFFEAPTDYVPGDGSVDELSALFSAWSNTIHRLIDRLPAETTRIAVHDLDPLETFVKGRLVLLGDAAHASTPTLGQGAGQAVEDAVVLARRLKTSTTIEEALRHYDAERRERTAAIMLAARARTRVILGNDVSLTEAWYARLRAGHRDFVEALEKVTFEGPLG